MNKLYYYAKNEWAVLNRKQFNKCASIFQKFTKDKILLFVPIEKRKKETIIITKKRGPNEWVQYIDDHIKEDLTVVGLADYYNYSICHFSDTFELFFGIRPGKYIKKRKLYLAANELKQGQLSMDAIVDKFGFQNIDQFREKFFEEFETYPENYNGNEYKADDISQFYLQHKDKIRIDLLEVEEFCMYGKIVSMKRFVEEDNSELTESIIRELQTPYRCEDEIKTILWQTIPETGKRACLVGPENDLQDIDSEEMTKSVVKGGAYIVVSSRQTSDKIDLKETYRMLYRCSFEGWTRENQVRVDFLRITFVRYMNEKLYFYIPVNA